MENPNYKKLIKVLEEVFQLNQADLDFGIYRIMNHKREEILQFLNKDLIPQAKEVLSENLSGDKSSVQKELDETIKAIQNAGMNPDDSPKVQQLRQELTGATDIEAEENAVFAHLANFFKRYYEGGDFISLRRYKEGVYAIPYEGEEVKLHWANHDQYYIKTSEYLKNYAFKLSNGKSVRFLLAEASTEQNNNKSTSGKERRFALYEEEPLLVNGEELKIFFTYEPMEKAAKQSELMKAAFNKIKTQIPADFQEVLISNALSKTEKSPNRTLLEKHFKDYVSRNTFDYFIHKNLGKFFKQELDFFIKNEVLFLDDINTRDTNDFVRQLSQVRAIKGIGLKVITFLEQLENFQKKLWLKKKFVVETQYCITLDRVPEELYPEIISNQQQIEEWKKLFHIQEIKLDEKAQKGLFDHNQPQHVAYSEPLKMEFLKANPFLVLDTKFYSEEFKDKLVGKIENLNEQLDGILFNAENFQALNLLQERYREQISCVYIDPPYNTGSDDFIYKDNYRHSSWATMMKDRLNYLINMLSLAGTFTSSIDLNSIDKYILLLDSLFEEENKKTNITIKRGSVTGAKVINPGVVNISENVLVYSRDANNWNPKKAYREKEYDTRYGSYIINPEKSFDNWEFTTVLEAFSTFKKIPKSKLKKMLQDSYQNELQDFVISNANRIIRLASIDEKSVSAKAVELKRESILNPDKILHLPREGKNDYYIKAGSIILFYKDRLIKIGDSFVPGEPLADIWVDVLPNDLSA